MMDKETLKTLAVKTESEEQSRVIVALFEAAGFEGDWGDVAFRYCTESTGTIYVNNVSEVMWADVLPSYNRKQVTFSEFIWDYCAPEWADSLDTDGKHFVWCSNSGNIEAINSKKPYYPNVVKPISTRHEPNRNPQWPEPGSLPPVGVECEWCSHNEGAFVKAAILADVGDNEFVIRAHGKKIIVKNPGNFRPIRTEREKFVEQALSLDCDPQEGMLSRRDFCGELYDAIKSGELVAPKVGE